MKALEVEAGLLTICIPHGLALARHMESLSVAGSGSLGLLDPSEHGHQSMLCTGCRKEPGT